MPNAVTLPFGEISVIRSPTRQAHAFGQARTDQHRVVAVEVVERAGDDVVGDDLALAQVLRRQAAHDGAAGDAVGR